MNDEDPRTIRSWLWKDGSITPPQNETVSSKSHTNDLLRQAFIEKFTDEIYRESHPTPEDVTRTQLRKM